MKLVKVKDSVNNFLQCISVYLSETYLYAPTAIVVEITTGNREYKKKQTYRLLGLQQFVPFHCYQDI